MTSKQALLVWLLLASAAAGSAASASAPAPAPAPAGAPVVTPVDSFTLAQLPAWTEPYRDENPGDNRLFDIPMLMRGYRFDRLEAMDVQQQFHVLSRDPSARGQSPEKWFETAVTNVRQGRLASRADRAALAKAPFIVAMDLDATLYDQFSANGSCSDYSVSVGGRTKFIKQAPGWEKFFDRVRALGGVIVIYSAGDDESTYRNLAGWSYHGKPLASSPEIAAILTNGDLVMSAGAKNGAKSVVLASKDLRALDESLKKVILVDDNPTLIFQPMNHRLVKKFKADVYCAPTTADSYRRAYLGQFARVASEIEESAAYARAHGVSFVDAYLPFSQIGDVTRKFLVEDGNFAPAVAIDFIRKNPASVEKSY